MTGSKNNVPFVTGFRCISKHSEWTFIIFVSVVLNLPIQDLDLFNKIPDNVELRLVHTLGAVFEIRDVTAAPFSLPISRNAVMDYG